MNDGNCQPELSPAAGCNSGELSQLSGEMKDSCFGAEQSPQRFLFIASTYIHELQRKRELQGKKRAAELVSPSAMSATTSGACAIPHAVVPHKARHERPGNQERRGANTGRAREDRNDPSRALHLL